MRPLILFIVMIPPVQGFQPLAWDRDNGCVLLGATGGFALGTLAPSGSKSTLDRRLSPTVLSVIDPATLWTTMGGFDSVTATLAGPEVGAAVIGAAAGALSQLPHINSLNEQVSELQLELETSQTNLTEKINLLEEKLFEMDREYEDQTARFKRQYDDTQRIQLEQLKEKLKREYQYKLDIQLEERKSEELMKKVGNEHKRTGRQQDMTLLEREKQKLQAANLELENALLRSEEELKSMMEAAATKSKKRFLLF